MGKWRFIKHSNPPAWSLSGYLYLIVVGYGDNGAYTWSVRNREDCEALGIGDRETLEGAKVFAELDALKRTQPTTDDAS